MTEAHVCEQLAQRRYTKLERPEIETITSSTSCFYITTSRQGRREPQI